MNKRLIVFTLNGCGFCKSIKQKLKDNSISFTEYEINEYPDLWEQVVSQTNSDYLPTFFIKDGDNINGEVFCPKKDFNDEEEILNILKEKLF